MGVLLNSSIKNNIFFLFYYSLSGSITYPKPVTNTDPERLRYQALTALKSQKRLNDLNCNRCKERRNWELSLKQVSIADQQEHIASRWERRLDAFDNEQNIVGPKKPRPTSKWCHHHSSTVTGPKHPHCAASNNCSTRWTGWPQHLITGLGCSVLSTVYTQPWVGSLLANITQ